MNLETFTAEEEASTTPHNADQSNATPMPKHDLGPNDSGGHLSGGSYGKYKEFLETLTSTPTLLGEFQGKINGLTRVEYQHEDPLNYQAIAELLSARIYSLKQKLEWDSLETKIQQQIKTAEKPKIEFIDEKNWLDTFYTRTDSQEFFQKLLVFYSRIISTQESQQLRNKMTVNKIKNITLEKVDDMGKQARELIFKLQCMREKMEPWTAGRESDIKLGHSGIVSNPYAGGFCIGDAFYSVPDPTKLLPDGTSISMTPNDLAIIETHEKGHYIRTFPEHYQSAINAIVFPGFSTGILEYTKWPAQELMERMAQLKNACGMTNADALFTSSHLDFCRKNYTGRYYDNYMTHFLEGITAETESRFLLLMNMLPL